jgi:hypothetical protein
MSSPSSLSELTVTCHQCGSASMERLDHKEYRCTHCGAITIISDDDAERVEELLRQALNRQPVASGRTPPRAAASNRKVAVVISLVVGLAIVLPVVLSQFTGHRSSPHHFATYERNTVPVSDVAVSQRVWNSERKRYEGTVYNHSGYAIGVPRYTMTLFTNGHRSGSTWSDTELGRLLPGEYEPISFEPHAFSSDAQPDRYELNQPTSVDRSTDEIARLALAQQQLVHQDGEDRYQLVGVIRNTFTRPIGSPRVLLVLYGPAHEVLGSGSAYLEKLRPGEDGVVDIKIYPKPQDAKVAAYEYIVDAAFDDANR